MTSTSLFSRLFLALSFIVSFGCKQEQGDTCIEDDDCSGSLICACKGSASARGLCMPDETECGDPPPEELDFGMIEEVDLGTDLGPEDMGSDDMGEGDAGAEDGGIEVDLGADGGAEDMGEPDLGTEDMGGPDLGAEDMS